LDSEGAAFENDSDSEGVYSNINLGFSSKATQTMLHGFATLPSSIPTQACASKIIPLDTDSSFLVCNNSATGHICNDKSLFSGEHVPSIYVVGAATGTSKPTLMGTLILCTTDDNGEKHTFVLTHVNYMPKLPVTLLSTQILSKQYVDENGFDKEGTGVCTVYDNHVLFVDYGQYSKTFKMHSSGLPECFFSSSYSHLNVFTTFLMQHYNNTINWAFTSKVKDIELAASVEGAGLATVQGNGDVSLDVLVILTNCVSSFWGMKLRYNDCLVT
jgi:hypothetical protein